MSTELVDRVIIEHHYAEVNGIRMHYVTAGQGSPLLLLHGWPETWWSWHRLMKLLGNQFRLIAPDLRGTGDTDKPEDGYDMPNLAEDAYQLLEILGIDRIGVVGHDVGTLPAYALACEHPERVSSLTILDVPLPGFGLEEFDASVGLWHHSLIANRQLAAKMVSGAERELLAYFFSQTPKPELFDEEEIAEYLRTYTQPGAMVISLRLMEDLFTDVKAQVALYSQRKLSMPVLALGGEYAGRTFPLQCYAQLAEHVEGGIVPGTGHWIPEESPDRLAAELTKFHQKATSI